MRTGDFGFRWMHEGIVAYAVFSYGARLLKYSFRALFKLGGAILLTMGQSHLAYDVQPCRHTFDATMPS